MRHEFDDEDYSKSRIKKIIITVVGAVIVIVLISVGASAFNNYQEESEIGRQLVENTEKGTQYQNQSAEKVDYTDIVDNYLTSENEKFNEYKEGLYEDLVTVNTEEADGKTCLSAEQFIYAYYNKRDTLKNMNISFKNFDFIKMNETRTRVYIKEEVSNTLVVLKHTDDREIFPEGYDVGNKFTQSVKIDNINIVKYDNINILFCIIDKM